MISIEKINQVDAFILECFDHFSTFFKIFIRYYHHFYYNYINYLHVVTINKVYQNDMTQINTSMNDLYENNDDIMCKNDHFFN